MDWNYTVTFCSHSDTMLCPSISCSEHQTAVPGRLKTRNINTGYIPFDFRAFDRKVATPVVKSDSKTCCRVGRKMQETSKQINKTVYYAECWCWQIIQLLELNELKLIKWLRVVSNSITTWCIIWKKRAFVSLCFERCCLPSLGTTRDISG